MSLTSAIDILVSKNHRHNNSHRVALRFNGTRNPFCVILREFNPVVSPWTKKPHGISFDLCGGMVKESDGLFGWSGEGGFSDRDEFVPIYSDPAKRVLDEGLLSCAEVLNAINAIAWFVHVVDVSNGQFKHHIGKMTGESVTYWRPTLFDALHELCLSFGRSYGCRRASIQGEETGETKPLETMPRTENERGELVPMTLYANSKEFKFNAGLIGGVKCYPFGERQYFSGTCEPEQAVGQSAEPERISPHLVRFSDERDARSSGFDPEAVYPVVEFCEENGTRYALIERGGEPIYVNAGRLTEICA